MKKFLPDIFLASLTDDSIGVGVATAEAAAADADVKFGDSPIEARCEDRLLKLMMLRDVGCKSSGLVI